MMLHRRVAPVVLAAVVLGSAPASLAVAAPAHAGDTTPGPQPPTPAQQHTISELLALGRPVVLAHTGGEDAYPGSTMYGFGESINAGVDMLDFNLWTSKDGVLVVQHDEGVERLTDGTGKVTAMTYAEIAKLDNAYWFTPDCGVCRDQPDASYIFRGVRTGAKPPPDRYAADDFRIPTLDDVLQRYPNVPLNLEIEGHGAEALRTAMLLADKLTRTNMLDRVVVASFDDAIVAAFHQMAPTVEISPGKDAITAYVLSRTPLPLGMRIMQLPPVTKVGDTDFKVITPELIRDAKRDHYPIWVWPNDRTLENLAAYRAFVAEGLDGLNINVPLEGVQAVGG